jgi:uncharacterized protein (TIGR02147 family)
LVIAGRRRLTRHTTTKIMEALALTRYSRRYFSVLVKYNNARSVAAREQLLTQLVELKARKLPAPEERQKIEYFAEWYYPVLREMVGIDGFREDEGWIASQLYSHLMPKEIRRALDLLLELGLVARDPQKRTLQQTGGQVRPNRIVSELAGIRYHERMLDVAKDAIYRVPPEQRDLNALTLCVSAKAAERLMDAVQDFCRRAMALEGEHADDPHKLVYQLNLQLFPFTRAAASARAG